MTRTVTAGAPELPGRPGVGYDSAAALLIAVGDNPERMKNEADFSSLCGVRRVEFSSGKPTKRRLNRGGNRQANHALWRIVLTRMGNDERTRKYVARRTADGRPTREIMRVLKRYVAREVYPHLINR